jgi:hypothetical protein
MRKRIITAAVVRVAGSASVHLSMRHRVPLGEPLPNGGGRYHTTRPEHGGSSGRVLDWRPQHSRSISDISSQQPPFLQLSRCSQFSELNCYVKIIHNSVVLVRERTIPTERPPLVGELSANFCG